MTTEYRKVGKLLMPFECPPEPSPNWLPHISPEQEAAAEKLWKAARRGGWMVTFQGQPKHVREEFLRKVGWTGEPQ